MLSFLKNHPFAVEAYFKSSTILTFAVPKEQLQSLIPECLELDTFDDKWAFVAVALVQTTGLRPKGFPKFLGNDFFLIGYRIFVRYTNTAGKRLRGLYILKSETDKKKMEYLGNIFTHYNYTTTDITQTDNGNTTEIKSKQSDFKIIIENGDTEVTLPQNSPFADWKEARRFAGPLPFTFTYNSETKKVLIIEGVRENWTPKPIKIVKHNISFLTSLNLQNAILANAFEVKDIPYFWKKGKIETMEKIRKPFQGVWNIIRFNWHFYVLSFSFLFILLLLSNYTNSTFRTYLFIVGLLIFLPTFISLSVSYYVYDLSGLYKLNWITNTKSTIININAGFDETSILLKDKFPNSELVVFDFYDPKKHTEISIKRARKAYSLFPNTKSVTATNLPTLDNSVDKIFVIFAAHEIRNEQERIDFFKELKRVLKPTGEIFITEHLRDIPNFLAYNIGFLHFYSKQTWLKVFQLAELTLKSEQKITPFISKFTLTKYGVAS